MSHALELLGTIGVFSSFVAAAYAIAGLVYPRETTGLRATATFVGTIFIHGVIFYALAIPGVFNRLAAVAVMAALFCATGYLFYRRRQLRDIFWTDVETSRRFLGEAFTGSSRLVVLAVVVVVALQSLRALVIPPMAWDSLTYHLVRAALWVKESGLETAASPSTYDAPLAWEYFRAFLPLGDSLSAWAMLMPQTDTLVPLVWVGVWLGGVQAAYMAARALGADTRFALAGALAAWTMPALAKHAFVAHIDNLLVALTIASFVMFVHAQREQRPSSSAFALAALGICAAVKATAAPFVAASVLAWATLLIGRHREQWRLALAAPLPALIVSLPGYIRQWVVFGSPTYPFAVEIGGQEIFSGSPEWGFVTAHESSNDWWFYVRRLVTDGPYGDYVTHINFGPLLPFAVAAGLVALFWVYRRREAPRLFLTYYFAAAVAGMVLLLASYSWTGNTIARHIAAGPILLVACATTLRHGAVRSIIELVALGNLVFLLPFNWSGVDVDAVWAFGQMLAPFVAAGAAVLWWGWGGDRRRLVVSAVAAGLSVLSALVFVLEPVRKSFRHRIYSEVAAGRNYANIPLGGPSGVGFDSASVWEAVDRLHEPLKLAVTGGWDGRGINWAVYPLFGQRLQNTLIYVPVTPGGEVVSPRLEERYDETADYAAWRERVLDSGADFVVTMGPDPLEGRWMEEHKDHFQRVTTGGHPDNRLYRVLPAD